MTDTKSKFNDNFESDGNAMLNVLQVAKFLATSPRSVYNLIESNQLAAVNVGTGIVPRWRITKEDFLKFQSRRRTRVECTRPDRNRDMSLIRTPQIMGVIK